MTLSRTQGVTKTTALNVSTATHTFGWTATAGRLIVVAAEIRVAGVAPTVTTAGYAAAESFINGGTGNPSCAIYSKIAAGGETSVDWSFGSTTNGRLMWAAEYSSTLGTLSLDQSATAGGVAATTIASGTTATTSVAEELCFAVLGIQNTDADGTWSVDSSFSKLCGVASATSHQTVGSGGTAMSGLIAERIVAATGTYGTTGTHSSSTKGAGAIATFGVLSTTRTLRDSVGITVEVGFNSAPTTSVASTSWTDVTAYARSVHIRRGRESEFDDFAAGTCEIELDNRDRRFDPNYAAGLYYGKLLPMKRVRVRATYSGTTYYLFTGFVDDWPQTYEKGDRDMVVPLTATDAFKPLSQLALPGSQFEYLVRSGSPFAWLPLSETSGLVALDRSGNLRDGVYDQADTTSRSTDALIVGGTPSIAFNGTSDVIQWTGIQNVIDFTATDPDPDSGGYGFSVEAVFRPDTIAAGSGYVWRFTDAGAGRGFSLDRSGSTLGYSAIDTLDEGVGVATASILTAGATYHVIVVQQIDSTGALGSCNLYVNGVDTPTFSGVTGNPSLTTTLSAYIGAFIRPTLSGNAFLGAIDEIVIWGGSGVGNELTSTEVTQHYNAAIGWRGLDTGTCVSQVLTLVGWPSSDISAESGITTVQAHGFDADVLTYLKHLEATEQGALFVSVDGKITFLNRHHWFTTSTATTSQATFGDSGAELRAADIIIKPAGDTFLRNRVLVTRKDSGTQEASDATSIASYFERSESITDLLSDDDLEMRDLAQWRVTHYAQPLQRIATLSILPRRSPTTLYPQVLAREIGDRVTVNRRPGGGTVITQDALLQGIEHVISPSEWETTWNLSPVDTQVYMVLDDATYGKLDTARLAY